MASRFSRFFDSGHTRSRSRETKHYDNSEHLAREYEYERIENDLAKANVIRELGRENSELTAQIRELRQETGILRDLIRKKEEEVRELQLAVEEMEFEDMNINEMADNNNKQIEMMNSKLTTQLTEIADKLEARIDDLEAKIDAKPDNDVDMEAKLAALMDEKTNSFSQKADELADKMYAVTRDSGVDGDQIVNIISENVHNESVKCYRNIQSLLEEMEDKLTAIENKKVSISGTTALVVITMLVSMGNLALIVLRILGMI